VSGQRNHPAEITACRLGDALDRWPSHFDGALRDEIGHVIFVLDEIAESEPVRGERKRRP
jgi:hypothetical protein